MQKFESGFFLKLAPIKKIFFQKTIIFMIGFLVLMGSSLRGDDAPEVIDTVTGESFTIVLKKDGTVWGWGKNVHGELGVGKTSATEALPLQTQSGLLEHVVGIDYDGTTVTARRDDGSIWKSDDAKKQVEVLISNEGMLPAVQAQQEGGRCIKKEKSPNAFDLPWGNQVLHGIENGGGSSASSPLMMGAASSPQNTWSSPDENPASLVLTSSGVYREPANIELVAHPTHSEKLVKINFYWGDQKVFLASVNKAPYQVDVAAAFNELFHEDGFSFNCLGVLPNGALTAGEQEFKAVAIYQGGEQASAILKIKVLPPTEYRRGWSLLNNYFSVIEALDFEEGVFLDERPKWLEESYPVHGIDPNNNFATLFPQGYPWFLRTASNPGAPKEECHHLLVDQDKDISYSTAVNKIPMLHGEVTGDAPPMVAFGRAGGGKELFVGQAYRFGIDAGGQRQQLFNNGDIKIEVYDKGKFLGGANNVAPIYTQTISLPRIGDANNWNRFNAEGFNREVRILQPYGSKTIDFDTQIQYVPQPGTWGNNSDYSFVLTHRAGCDDFYFKISVMGATHLGESHDFVDMAKNAAGTLPTYNLSYTLDFDAPAPWHATFLNQPHFQGVALPSSYQGKSIEELMHQKNGVVDTLPLPTQLKYDLRALDNSPELKSHPELDRLVEDYGGDPMALANYVFNEIELSDAIGYNVAGQLRDTSINPQGVSRDALGTYLEGEGSPAEQCALLIYLLRKAGYPAAYVFPEHNGMLMLDDQLSKLLQMQIRGIKDSYGETASEVHELIPVNYPWVATYVNGKWIHLFPWLKDTDISEGKNLFNYFPDGYQTGAQWLTQYLLNNPEIRSLSKKDNLGALFTIYAQNKLAEAGLTIDDVGMHVVNRRHNYTSWEEFPQPWQTPNISEKNLAQNLDVHQNNPLLASALENIFDTLEITVFSDRGNKVQLLGGDKVIKDPLPEDPTIKTGVLRMVDLHSRRFLLRHEAQSNGTFKMILSLESYDSTPSSTDTETYSFNAGAHPDPGSLRSHQEAFAILQTSNDPNNNDNYLRYNIRHLRHQQAQALLDKEAQAESKLNAGDSSRQVIFDYLATTYPFQFPGVGETTIIEDCRPLLKGDMAVLNLNYGRVTPKMQEFEAKKYWNYQQYVAANPKAPINPEVATGQLLQVMGQSYYYKLTQFHDFLEPLLKVRCITTIAHGFTKLSPARNPDGTPVIINVNGHPDLKLAYPNVDMSFQDVAYVNPCMMHPDSGDTDLRYLDAMQLEIGDGSANEHRIINEFFGQDAAISTVRLLDIAQGWTPTTGVAAHPGSGVVKLTKENYLREGDKSYNGSYYGQAANRKLAEWNESTWGSIKDIFENRVYNPDFSTVFITPTPVTASGQQGQPFTGVGAMVLGMGSYGAYISGNMIVTHGGSGGAVNYNVPGNDPPPVWVSGGSLNLTDDGAVYNNVASNVVNNGDVNYYDNSGSANNFDASNNQVAQGSLQLDPQQQSNLGAYQQNVDSTCQQEPFQDGESDNWNPSEGGFVMNNPASGSVAAAPQQNIGTSGKAAAELLEEQANRGDTGSSSFYSSIGSFCSNFVYDPVSVVTGEFYINALDLKLNGPMPLEIRRSYSSQNQANNNFGYGWKLSYFPYLMVSSDNDTKPSFIYAAEMDGSVIAYRRDATGTSGENIWIPKAVDNPNLINLADGSPGASKNFFNNRITQQTIDGVLVYTLKGVDGSTRIFRTRSFPVVGSSTLTRTRPYLESWRDAQGNCYNFTFGNDTTSPDYGELTVIASSNGNSIHFHYDTKGHIIEAISNDGRLLKYEYSSQGDLAKVTLPDASIITYDYEKKPNPSGKKSYSTHLLVEEKTPGGRVLRNSYDSQRRVVSQASTVGTSPAPTTSATFAYANSINTDKTLNGTTKVTDINGNATTYMYANSQTTSTTYPKNEKGVAPTIVQEWYSSDGYPRSLKKRTDRRGLVTEYQYDAAGNLISRSITGDLTGHGGSETATATYTYNNNLLIAATDTLEKITSYLYNESQQPTTVTVSAAGHNISSTQLQYTNVGGACGLISSIVQDGSTSSYSYDAHGFLAMKTVATGTADPQITTTYKSNRRGEIVSETDSIGRIKKYSYDNLGRRTGVEIYDAHNELVDAHFNFYNGNGEITWEQGAHYNPADNRYSDYDRAGHLIHQLTWLAQASPDGSCVIDGGVAETSCTYDGQGNLKTITDPNGHTTTMSYNALGEMTERSSGSGAANETFSHNAGGDVTEHTTLLNGKEKFSYTSLGQIASATHADGTTTSYHYDLAGRLAEEVLPNGSIWKTSYDNGGEKVTRAFCNAQGAALAVESKTYDARGNLIEQIDRNNNKWAMTYDALNRIKTRQGPSNNATQQSARYEYPRPDCVTIVNGVGESNNILVDALGRMTQTTVFNADGSIAKTISNQYSPDHYGLITTVGSGTHAITTTTLSDTAGRPLLIKGADGRYQFNTYDPCGNKIAFCDEQGKTTNYTYDGLNHLASATLPNGAVINYTYNAVGELELRNMLQNIVEKNTYNSAGQKTSSVLIGSDKATTRNYTYQYQNGLLSLINDPRGFKTTIDYDAWQRPIKRTSEGSSVPEQNQTTTYAYNLNGQATSLEQHYNDASTGPSTEVSRSYDAYDQLLSEATSINGKVISSWDQTWDGAGRRNALHWNLDSEGKGAQYQFSYNALGLPVSVSNITGTCHYNYGDEGLLLSKSTPNTSENFMRDKRGRLINLNTYSTAGTILSEHLDWNPNSQLKSYNVLNNRLGMPMESRCYEYDERNHLTKEPYVLRASLNESVFSNGTHNVLYSFDQLGSRISASVSPTGSNLEGSTGDAVKIKNNVAQVEEEINYSSGWYYYPWKISYDEQGEVITRSIEDTTTQQLTWDSFGHLVTMNQRGNSNINSTTVYDGLGRRIQTSTGDDVVYYYYDPEVEFLEIGHNVNGNRTWNLYGPDRSGSYGGAQGIGGLEAAYQEASDFKYNTINNYFGDTIGIIAPTYHNPAPYEGVVGGYGAMPGSEVNHDLEPQWRGHYLDKSGFYYMGARYYDPQAGRFLSPDPLGHDASLDLYSYCNGDPVNGLDPDGRCAEGASAGWGNGEGQFAGMYDSSQANSQLGYNLGWTAGAAAGDVNAVVGAVGNGINATVDFAEDIARVPRGSLTAGSFMFGPEVGGAVSGLRAWGSAMKTGGAVENTSTALSTFRYTSDGETFFHYGYAEHAVSFENGLQPGGYATTIEGLSGPEAKSGLSLRHAIPPNAVYTITPNAGSLIRVNPVAEPLFGQPGKLPEVQFPMGTQPGTVSKPNLIPH